LAETLWALVARFALLSLVAIGGAVRTYPAMIGRRAVR